MLKIIFILQMIIYLLASPLFKETNIFGYNAPIYFGIIAIASFIIGSFFYKEKKEFSKTKIVTTKFVKPFIILLGILYCLVSYNYNLFNRRLGSEIIADIYGSMPFVPLLVLRIYEISIIPLLILLIFSNKNAKWTAHAPVLLVFFISIPFMGIFDSRAKLLILILNFFIFIKLSDVRNLFKSSMSVYSIAIIAVISFFYVSLERMNQYTVGTDFYIAEVFDRLDGLTLVRDLNDSQEISVYGNYDFSMFSPFLSKIAFSEQAKYLKSIGKTSTKQYYLQDVLGRTQLDSNNSMITDPLYLAGVPGIIIFFGALGFFISKFDMLIDKNYIFKSKTYAAAIFSFGTSFILFEWDFFSSIINFFQNFVIFFLVLNLGTKKIENLDIKKSRVYYDNTPSKRNF